MVELIVDTYLKQDYKPRTKDLTTSVYSHPSGAGLCVIIISILFTNFMSLLHAKYGGMASVLTVGPKQCATKLNYVHVIHGYSS